MLTVYKKKLIKKFTCFVEKYVSLKRVCPGPSLPVFESWFCLTQAGRL